MIDERGEDMDDIVYEDYDPFEKDCGCCGCCSCTCYQCIHCGENIIEKVGTCPSCEQAVALLDALCEVDGMGDEARGIAKRFNGVTEITLDADNVHPGFENDTTQIVYYKDNASPPQWRAFITY